ncbi:MAG: energy-coupling factor transporter transmembrane protein EcfT [Clostridia bacterium]|nr:energy-coupling factor transporter transmembrane protein EcfT [Clostridia bacterium]
MLKDITLGQYYPVKSFVHGLDPRCKILLTIAFIVAVFLGKTLWAAIPVAAFILLAAKAAKLPLKLLVKGVRPLRVILLFTFVLNLFFTAGDTALVSFWGITVTLEGLLTAIRFSLRLLFLVTGASVLTLTTPPVMLTDGLERLLSPLRRIGFPAHELAMMMSIALRFIPTLLEEADKIMKAQMARGADFESGNLLQRARAMVPLLVPLFVSAFRRAGDLAMAMEARCYHGGEGRTRLRVLKLTKNDLYAALAVAALIAVVAFL